jgi:hypothetical protein
MEKRWSLGTQRGLLPRGAALSLGLRDLDLHRSLRSGGPSGGDDARLHRQGHLLGI